MWFRDNVGFIIEQEGSLWCTKQLKHVKWSSADSPWDIVQRLVTNVAKFVYFSTLNITDIEQFLPAAAIDRFSADTGIPVNLRQLATNTMHRQQNQVGNGSKLALESLKIRLPRQDYTKEERMTVWENAFDYDDPTVQDVFAHALIAVDLREIMYNEEDRPTKIWTKILYTSIMDLRWQYAHQTAILSQQITNGIKLKEETSRLTKSILDRQKALRKSIPVQFHITSDIIEVTRLFGKERRRQKRTN